MEIKSDKSSKYNKVLSRMQDEFSKEESFYILIRLYLTNNIYFYSLCIIFRFIPILIISGDYITKPLIMETTQSFQVFLKAFTFHNLSKQFNFSYKTYIIICLIFYVLIIIRLINYFIIIRRIKKKQFINKLSLLIKYQIIMDHLSFLFLPYILEFLSFSYYIYLFPDNFVINHKKNTGLIIIIITNTLLIIIYNIINYLYIICSNKKYTITEIEALSRIKYGKNFVNKNPILYKSSNIVLFSFILLQNFVLFFTIENYFSSYYKKYYKIITSAVLLLIFLFLIFNLFYEYNYQNFINSFINIFIFFCFYSIIIDIILYFFNHKLKSNISEVIYNLVKILLASITYLLIIFQNYKSLENQIIEILFKHKNIKKKEKYLDALLYLNKIMLKIKEKNDSESSFQLLKFLYKHINSCNINNCNCKLLNVFIQEQNNKKNNKNEKNTSNVLIILNYLYESAFLEYDYYNRYNMVILLAEHFCHLKDNPIMAFSFINSLIINHRNKLSKFQIVELYELNQKYIYFIQAKEKCNKDYEITENKNELLSKVNRADYYINYFNSLNLSNKIKRIINNYIDNFIKILKNKNIFEESLSFKFDENNENIIFVMINYFEQNSFLDEIFKLRKKITSNLYYIIYLLKEEIILYNNIINYVNQMNIFKDVPIFIIYKYYLFFDIFGGGIVPQEISNKLYLFISENRSIYDNKITNRIYALLKIRYNQQNNKNNSKYFAMYEYKNELSTKYFNEECALRLGFKQKDIINKKIDELMPNEFCNSHQNIIKKILMGDQLKYFFLNKSYLFDESSTVLYSIIPRAILIYSLSKYLIIISENTFKYENEYNFMLNHNFEILAISKNFEEEYLLNQKIFHLYDLKIMDILNFKPDKIHQKFHNVFKYINQNNLLRKIKTEEYFIPQFYVSSDESNNGMFKYNNFINTKNQIISNISKLEDKEINDTINDVDENEQLLKNSKIQKEVFDFFINPGKIIIHNTINFKLNKMKFIENIFKELTKIPDNNELFSDNENNIHNLIISSKKLINKLLCKNDLSNNSIEISIKLNYYYDKPFYFIIINDNNKLYLNISNQYTFQNSTKQLNIISSNIKTKIDNLKKPFVHLYKNNDGVILKNGEGEGIDKNNIINKIEKYRDEINKETFIFIIKFILFFSIFCIFIVYIIIIYYQVNSVDITEKILLSYYYNAHTRAIILNAFSKLNGIYHDTSGIYPSTLSNSYGQAILSYSFLLRENYHSFNNYYVEYNTALGQSLNTIYKDVIFYKLRGFWQEVPYVSKYSSELDFLIHTIYLMNVSITTEYLDDVNNFLFYKKKENCKDKIYTTFIKLLFYLMINYDYKYKIIFNELGEEIYTSYNKYIKKINIVYYILEIGGLLFYLILFIAVLIYLYYSNLIIIKNIIFLFLDFDEESDLKKKNNAQLIKMKLLKFKYLIDDFDLNELQKYFDDLDNLNNNKNDDIELVGGTLQNKNNENQIIANSNELNRRSSKTKLQNKKDKLSQITSEPISNENSNHDLQKMKSNNSSYNYLVGFNSRFFKNSLNANSFGTKDDLLLKSNLNLSNKNNISNSMNDYLFKNNGNNNLQNKNNELNINENMQDIILNKSNKVMLLIIKRYILIMIFFSIIIIIYIVYKIINNTNYYYQSNKFFNDFKVLTTRYTNIYYYFISLKSLFIYSDKDPRWNDTMNIMYNMNRDLDISNSEYNEIVKHKISSYNEVSKLLDILQYNKNDSSNYISKTICQNLSSCQSFLQSGDSLFRSGIDVGFINCFSFMNNIFLDYKNLKNKTDINEIVSSITGSQFFEFRKLRKCFSNIFYYVQQMIYTSFENDQYIFRRKYKKNLSLLNIISLLLSSLILLYVFIVIFIAIQKFTRPIEDSTYRINLSFYYIKKYKCNCIKSGYNSIS